MKHDTKRTADFLKEWADSGPEIGDYKISHINEFNWKVQQFGKQGSWLIWKTLEMFPTEEEAIAYVESLTRNK